VKSPPSNSTMAMPGPPSSSGSLPPSCTTSRTRSAIASWTTHLR
jgi:hypothetical protein